MSFCQRLVIDGEVVIVRVTAALTQEEIEAFTWIVRAARKKFESEQEDKVREDRHTNTPEQAALYEAQRGMDEFEDDRPTLAECQREEDER